MARFFHPLIMILARAAESDLAQYVEYLKAENRILRDKLPKWVVCRPAKDVVCHEWLGGLLRHYEKKAA